MEITERIIIEQLKRGNEEAYKLLYRHHYALLCHVAHEYVEDGFLSETLVGDVIFHLWEVHETLDIQVSLRSYLVRAYGITAWITCPPRRSVRKWLFLLFRKKGKCIICSLTIILWEVCWNVNWRRKFIMLSEIYRKSAGKFLSKVVSKGKNTKKSLQS